MIKEELEKEAREYALEWGDKTDGTYACCKDGYLAGAEPREKRIVELERKLEQTEKDLADYQFNYPTIKELQAENEELKEEMKAKQVVLNDFKSRVETVTDRFNKKSSQLTKAKDLLLRFVDLKNKPCAVGHSVNMLLYENICAEVGQFLKEMEK